VEYEKLTDDRAGETSERVRERVKAAREIQGRRFQGNRALTNAEMGPAEVRQFCPLEPGAQALLRSAMKQLSLSARAFHRVLKLARTIADLCGSEAISPSHLAEALQYRPRTQVG